jgi:hypothetical protein
MAKKTAIYAPGELDRVRNKLGNLDADEARALAKKFGGEVGYERTAEEEKARQGNKRKRGRLERIGDRPGRRVEMLSEFDDEFGKPANKKSDRWGGTNPADDPLIPVKAGYWERIKMDKLAGQPEFEIKTPGQVFYSIISLFVDIIDYVSPIFVTRRMPEYYKKIEVLVVSTRNLFPRNNFRRNERMKKASPLAYSILDVIRYWDIEKISGDLAKIQARPKNARVGDFADILRVIYKPLFIMGRLNLDAHIRGAYKILYKLLYIESPIEAQNKYQELVRSALIAYSGIQREISYLLYPLLMKIISSSFVPYGIFFTERKNRYLAFLNITEDSQIKPEILNIQVDSNDTNSGAETPPQNEETAQAPDIPDSKPDEPPDQPKEKKEEISEEEKEKRTTEDAERKALERGLNTMEMLFPKAGWERPSTYPDFYPYFAGIFGLKSGIVNIAPTDPMQQIFILMRSLEELFFGLRYVKFGSVPGSSGNMERVDNIFGDLINNWHYYIELSFEKEYLPRMTEYIRILEGAVEERNTPYTRRLITELHLVKRLYLLPFYKFESLVPPTIQKKDAVAIYAKIRSLRKYLSAVAAGIEYGNKAGGAEVRAACDGIENPWDPYVFQVPNPLSMRLDTILGAKMKTNASLIYFCLAIATVLDHLLNSENSWAYSVPSMPLFRSVGGDGITPLIGVDDRIDADEIFRQTQRQRQRNNAK